MRCALTPGLLVLTPLSSPDFDSARDMKSHMTQPILCQGTIRPSGRTPSSASSWMRSTSSSLQHVLALSSTRMSPSTSEHSTASGTRTLGIAASTPAEAEAEA
eukprot:scaffold442_cov397-Prasinococcus_capsulatus_cf.AAC.30